jgi:hypothetical protein
LTASAAKTKETNIRWRTRRLNCDNLHHTFPNHGESE